MGSEYHRPADNADAEFTVRGSRFVARAEPAANRADAMAAVERARAAHSRARHHCWAYLVGDPASGQAGSSDDGEPSGTAGQPILGVIQHHGLGDVVVVVSRYFGGVKLGAGGLIRAYARSAQAVLSELPRAWCLPPCVAELRLDFASEHAVRRWLTEHGGTVEAVSYDDGVTIRLSLPCAEIDALSAFAGAQGITWQLIEPLD